MALYCELENIITESDVEQKFIYPFLKAETPIGLGLKDSEILTKHILRKKLIDKGQKQKYYFPDYLVAIRGIPTLILEAKAPNELLANGYSEARLYAQEVSASFPHKINACQYIIASNGCETWMGYVDQAEPVLRLIHSDFNIENKLFCELVEHCSHEALLNLANRYYVDLRGNARFNSPVSQLGGKRVQNEEMVENSFGRTLVFENRSIFDPETEQDRTVIVKNAYIPSPKREQHIEPIYKEIKRFDLPSRKNSTALSTETPVELVDKLSEKILNNQEAYSLMLLIGNVGSGKTTFTRYFRYAFLEEKYPELAARCEWIFINMNLAPVSNNEIYNWLKKQIIDSIKETHNDLDFEDFGVIKRVFRREISRFDKGLGSLLCGSDVERNRELYKILNEAIRNVDSYLEALLFFIKENYAKIPIVVLDNCDKRNKGEQLLMFEVAQWLRAQYKCIVILPMRDATYDTYKSEPPLDTVVRDLVFRIDPPDLLRVLQARLDYITRITEQSSNTYILENGMRVAVKRSELIEYFKYIIVAIRKDRWVANLFYRLADKNTRNGIQIFEDFCKSGHMKEKDILAMRVLGDDAQIPAYRFENVLLRKNRRFYNGDESNFVNLFASDYNDDFPDPFVRADILNWLYQVQALSGPTGDKGLFQVSELARSLQVYGHSLAVIYRELAYLARKNLVLCENSAMPIEEGDLVKITIPGALHLQMLRNVSYLSACAEDTLFKNTEVMTRISNRLKFHESDSKLVVALNARDLVNYLIEYRKEYLTNSDELVSEKAIISSVDLNDSLHAVEQWIQADENLKKTISEIDYFTVDMDVDACVVSKNSGGVVCTIADKDVKGFISSLEPKYSFPRDVYSKIKPGDILKCKVMEFDFTHRSFQLKYLN